MINNLNDWLAYLDTVHFKPVDLGLDRIKAVEKTLNLLPFSCPVITVTGTNGKGSCVAFMEIMLRTAGYSVGTYTSPHLLTYNERVRINAVAVTDEALCAAFSSVEKARKSITLTYFEMGTLAALWLFKQANLDIIILEIGLGGKLDAVNIVDADISVISTIALDHTEWLGNDRETIGYEKAGIFRAGKPAVCGDFDVPESVKKYAASLGTNLYMQDKDFGYQKETSLTWAWWSKTRSLEKLPIPAIELQNAATALKAIELLENDIFNNGKKIKKTVSSLFNPLILKSALQQVSLLGRFQIIPGKIVTVLDVAHNPAAGNWLAKQLGTLMCQRRMLAVVAMLSHKNQRDTVAPLVNLINRWYVGGLRPTERMHAAYASNGADLISHLKTLQAKNIHGYGSVTEAYKQAQIEAKPDDCIVVFGSFHTVVEVLLLIN